MADQRTQIAAYFFFAVFLYVLYQIVQIFSPFFQAFFWAVVLTFAFYPLHRLFLRLFGGRVALAAFVTTCSIIFIVITPAFAVLQSIVRQTLQLYQLAIRFIEEGRIESLILSIQTHPWYQAIQERALRSDILSGVLREHASTSVLRVTQFLANTATSQFAYVTKNVFFISLNLLLMVVLIFVLFKNGEALYQAIYKLIPMDDQDRKALSHKVTETFAGVIRGQFLTSLIQSVLAGLTFFFLGFPASSLFGLATFMSSLVPVVGASAIWFPCVIYLFVTQQVIKGVILLVVGTFVISLSDNILKPILVSEKTKIPVFLLFLGIFGGMGVYGITGVFLAPVFIALLFALIEIYRGRYQ